MGLQPPAAAPSQTVRSRAAAPFRMFAATQNASAVVLLVCGFVILTRPLAIPFTIALWLGAAALTGFAVFTRLADN